MNGDGCVGNFTSNAPICIFYDYDFYIMQNGQFQKGATSALAHLDKFSLNILSSSFAIRVNLLHPIQISSLFLYGLLLSLGYFPILVKKYFQFSSM